jgi:hypothetical protein
MMSEDILKRFPSTLSNPISDSISGSINISDAAFQLPSNLFGNDLFKSFPEEIRPKVRCRDESAVIR